MDSITQTKSQEINLVRGQIYSHSLLSSGQWQYAGMPSQIPKFGLGALGHLAPMQEQRAGGYDLEFQNKQKMQIKQITVCARWLGV